MSSYETTVDIDAPVDTVLAVTRDIETWPDWSPTMTSVRREDTGPIGPGSKARVRQPKLRPATWVVDTADAASGFVWHTGGPGYRILAEHLFEPRGDRTGVVLRATVSGALAPVLWRLVGGTVRRYLDEEAAGLKRRCETCP